MRWEAKLYLWVVSLGGIAIAFVYLPLSLPLLGKQVFTLGVFTFIAFLAEIYEIVLLDRRGTSTAIALYFAAILLGGLPLGLGVVLLSGLSAEIFLRWDFITSKSFARFFRSVSFNTSQQIVYIFLAALVYTWAGGHPLFERSSGATGILGYQSIIGYLPIALAYIVASIANTSLVAGIIRLTQGVPFFYQLKFNLQHLHIQLLSLGVLGILIAVIYAQNPWNLILLLIPLVLVHISLRDYTKLRVEAKNTFEQMIHALSERDPYTFEHSEEVAQLSAEIAREMRLPPDQVETIQSAALIHDIGKIGIPDRILRKPGPLDDEEWEIMRRHPVIGAELIKGMEIYGDGVQIVRHEHEHWDGQGYPDGLAGEDIPIGARIVAVADSYNALTTDRPYRKAYPPAKAFQIIREESGTHLDPQAVEAFFHLVERQQRLN